MSSKIEASLAAALGPQSAADCAAALHHALRVSSLEGFLTTYSAFPALVERTVCPRWFAHASELHAAVARVSQLVVPRYAVADAVPSAWSLCASELERDGVRCVDGAVPSGCRGIDEALGGTGFRRGSIVEMAGAAGAGKTQIALTALVACALRCDADRSDGVAVYLASEDIPVTRLQRIAAARCRRAEQQQGVAATNRVDDIHSPTRGRCDAMTDDGGTTLMSSTTAIVERALSRIVIRKLNGTEDDLITAVSNLSSSSAVASAIELVVVDSIYAALGDHVGDGAALGDQSRSVSSRRPMFTRHERGVDPHRHSTGTSRTMPKTARPRDDPSSIGSVDVVGTAAADDDEELVADGSSSVTTSSLAQRVLRVGSALRQLAVRRRCAVVVTNQVRRVAAHGSSSSYSRSADADFVDVPALGLAWADSVTTRLWVEKLRSGLPPQQQLGAGPTRGGGDEDDGGGGERAVTGPLRRARVVFSPELPEGSFGYFTIDESGAA